MRPTAALLAALVALAAPSAAAPAFKTANPPTVKTSGALVFRSREDVKACFARVFQNTSAGFKQCEGLAKAIVPAGASLKVIRKVDDEVVAMVQVLDGKAKGTEGWIHELWITPSPWAGR
jgi:hypothetical protein